MRSRQQSVRREAFFYLVAVLMALAVKQHYSQARPEDLLWILKPTAGLVSLLNGDVFIFEAGAGYACHVRNVIIAPACAGVNFLIMAFGMAVFSGVRHMRGWQHGVAWLLSCLVGSYLLTLVVNALRIVISIYTYNSGAFADGMMWERIHRLEGVVIYFFFQYLFYSMIQKVVRRYSAGQIGRKTTKPRKILAKGMMPCAWYLGVTLAVPFLNRAAARYGSLFFEHAAMVLSLCLMTWTGIAVVELCGQGIRLFFYRGLSKP
jgi:exosortase K